MERRKFIKSAGIAGILASGTAPAIVTHRNKSAGV